MRKVIFKLDRRLFKKFKFYKIFRRILFALIIKKHNISLQKIKNDNFYPLISKKQVLFASFIGGNSTIMGFESFLATELEKRGATCKIVLCDKSLPACLECTYISKPLNNQYTSNSLDSFCAGCFTAGKINTKRDNLLNLNHFKTIRLVEELSDKFSKFSNDEMKNYEANGIHVGEHALAGSIRYLSKSKLDDSLKERSVLLNYLISSETTRITFENIVNKIKPDIVFTIHGLYSPHGIVSEICKVKNIKHINWNVAYRKKTFIFSPEETYHKSLVSEEVDQWKNMDFNETKKQKIISYLQSREEGSQDWISFLPKDKSRNFNNFELRIRELKKTHQIVTLLTNVSWDAQIHYNQNIFDSMIDWIYYTIDWFLSTTNKVLIIRIHPAEVNNKYPTKEKISSLIRQKYLNLPNNIFLVDSDNPINTYSICDLSDRIIIYGTKMGVEIAHKEIPIIVAGEAWIKNKGFTHDPKTIEEYNNLLENLDSINLPSNFDKSMALKYAYHFFFEIMKDVRAVKGFIDPGCIVFDKKNYNKNEVDQLLISLMQ